MFGHPFGFSVELARTQRAMPNAPHFLRGHEPSQLEHLHMLLEPRQSHPEVLGQIGDRSVLSSETLENSPSRRVGESGEARIESRYILNHMVQYILIRRPRKAF